MTQPYPSEQDENEAKIFDEFTDEQVVAILIMGAPEWEPIKAGSYRQEVIKFSNTHDRLCILAESEYNDEKLFLFAENMIALRYMDKDKVATRMSAVSDRMLP